MTMGWDNLLVAALAVMLGALLVAAGIEDARTREIANVKNAAIALLAPLWWWALGLGWAEVGYAPTRHFGTFIEEIRGMDEEAARARVCPY